MPRRFHKTCTLEEKGACTSYFRFKKDPEESIRFLDVNDPRPGGRAAPRGEGGYFINCP
jgi:hypothetical protein